MDDLNKKRSSKHARQPGSAPAPAPAATDTQPAVPVKNGEAVKSGNGSDTKGAAPGGDGSLTASGAGSTPARSEAAIAPTAAGASVPAAGMAAPEIVHAPAGRKRPVKTVRASYAVPKDDLATLDALKEACRGQGVKTKKNQLLRVAIGLLRDVEPARLAELVAALPQAGHKRK